jgi:hypothetical protein
MPKILCPECQVEFRLETNGVKVKETFQAGQQVYRIWDADLWRCPRCGIQVVAGFGNRPLAEHFEDNFKEVLARVEGGHDPVFIDNEL